MIIQLFKNRHSISQLLILFVVVTAMFAQVFIYPITATFTGSSFFDYAILDISNIPYKLNILFAYICVLLTCFVIQLIVVSDGFNKRGSYISLLIFLMLMTESGSFLMLTPPLLVMPLGAMILHRIFNLSKNAKPHNAVLTVSILASISTIIYTPMIVSLIAVIIGIILFSSLSPRLIIISILGFITPIILIHSSLFAIGNAELIVKFINETEKLILTRPVYDTSFFLNAATYLLLFISLPTIYGTRSDSMVDTHRKFNMLTIIVIIIIILSALTLASSQYVFMLSIVPISIMLGFMFQYSGRTIIQEILLLTIVLMSLILNHIII